MTPRSIVHAVVVAALLPAIACRDTLAPSDVAGRYALQSIAAMPLPAEASRNEHMTLRIDADTVQLRRNGTATIVTVSAIAPLGVVDAPPERLEATAHYRIRGREIEITMVCPPNASCVKGPHIVAQPVGNGLHARYVYGNHRAPFVYSRTGRATPHLSGDHSLRNASNGLTRVARTAGT